MSSASAFDGLAERLQRARADYEIRPSQKTWIALLEAENAWLKRRIAEGKSAKSSYGHAPIRITPDTPIDHHARTGSRRGG